MVFVIIITQTLCVSESIKTKGVRVHTGEIIFLSKSEITSEMHRQSMYRNVSLLYDTWRDDYNVTTKQCKHIGEVKARI